MSQRGVMRANNWILAGASAGVMLMVLEAVYAELTPDNVPCKAMGAETKGAWSGTTPASTVCALNQVAIIVAPTLELPASPKG